MSDRTPDPGEEHADTGSAPDDAHDHAGSPAAASAAVDAQADPVAAAAQAVRDADAEAATQDAATRDTGAELTAVLTSRGYRALLAISALIGVPVALVAFGFLALVHWLEHVVWESLPETLGMSEPAGWYAIVVLTLAGLIVGVTIKRLPGTGGHIPVHGLGGGTPSIPELPAILIAAIVSLTLGTVVGPEAPLVAIGAGAVLVMIRRTRLHHQPQAQQLLAIAGSSAAIATIFGNPVVGAVLMLEVVGLAAGAQVLVALLPAILSAGVGALVFTGLGEWTGFDAPSLTIPGLGESGLEAGDLLWTIPIAIVVAVLAQVTRRIGLRVADAAARRTIPATTAVGLVVGLCAAVYALITDRPVSDVLFSGETALTELVGNPQEWAVGTLLLLLLFKGIAYAVSIGAFRGGPTFPALFLGAAFGIVVGSLPGFDVSAGIAVGMAAATTAVLRLPITSIVLVTLLLGSQALSQIPIVMIAAVIGLVTAVSLDRRESLHRRTPSEPTPAAPA
jgi:H+/Cl- antiporter ClcA